MHDINEVRLASDLEVKYTNDDMVIIRSWFSWPKLVFFLLVLIAYWGLVVRVSFIPEMYSFEQIAGFGLGGFVMFLAMVYALLGKTFLTVNPDMIARVSFPLPWFGDQRFYVYRVKKLYIKEKISIRKGKREDEFANKMEKDQKRVTYALTFLLDTGEETELLVLNDQAQAAYLEQAIQKQLVLMQAQTQLY